MDYVISTSKKKALRLKPLVLSSCRQIGIVIISFAIWSTIWDFPVSDELTMLACLVYSHYPSNQPFLVSNSKWLGYWPLSLYTKKMNFHSCFKDKVGINMNSFMFFLRQLTKILQIPFFEGMSHKLMLKVKVCIAELEWHLSRTLFLHSSMKC